MNKRRHQWRSVSMVVVQSFGAFGTALQLIVIARLGGISDTGTYALANGIAVPVALLLGMGLRETVQLHRFDADTYPRFIGMRLLFTLPLVATCLLVTGLVDGVFAQATLLMIAARSLDQIGDLAAGIFIREEKVWKSSVSLLLNPILTAVAMGVVLSGGSSLIPALWASVAVSMLLGALVPLLIVGAGLPRVPTLSFMRDSVNIGAPLALSSIVLSMRLYAPRYFLAIWGSVDDVAIFSAATSLLQGPSIILTALGRTVLSPLSRGVSQGVPVLRQRLFTKFLITASALSTVSALLWIAFGPLLTRLLFGGEFVLSPANTIMLSLTVVVLGPQVVFRNGMVASALTRRQLQLSLISVAFLAAVSVPLVKFYGTSGAAAAMVLGSIAFTGLAGLTLRRERV